MPHRAAPGVACQPDTREFRRKAAATLFLVGKLHLRSIGEAAGAARPRRRYQSQVATIGGTAQDDAAFMLVA